MWTKFLKACPVGFAIYILPFLFFNITAWKVIATGIILWTAFGLYRLGCLLRRRAYRRNAPEWDREDFGFWLGAVISPVVAAGLFLCTPLVKPSKHYVVPYTPGVLSGVSRLGNFPSVHGHEIGRTQ